MECLNCGKEIETKGTKPKKYCSDRCRKAYKRTRQADTNGQQTDKIAANGQISVPETHEDVPGLTNSTEAIPDIPSATPNITKLTRAQLYAKIRAYKADGWVGSPEHKELMLRLRTWPVFCLKANKYFIPCWRLSMEAA